MKFIAYHVNCLKCKELNCHYDSLNGKNDEIVDEGIEKDSH